MASCGWCGVEGVLLVADQVISGATTFGLGRREEDAEGGSFLFRTLINCVVTAVAASRARVRRIWIRPRNLPVSA